GGGGGGGAMGGGGNGNGNGGGDGYIISGGGYLFSKEEHRYHGTAQGMMEMGGMSGYYLHGPMMGSMSMMGTGMGGSMGSGGGSGGGGSGGGGGGMGGMGGMGGSSSSSNLSAMTSGGGNGVGSMGGVGMMGVGGLNGLGDDGIDVMKEAVVHGSLFMIEQLLNYGVNILSNQITELIGLILEFREFPSHLIQASVLDLLPQIAWQFRHDFIKEDLFARSIAHLCKCIKSYYSRLGELAFQSIGKIAIATRSAMVDWLPALMKSIKDCIRQLQTHEQSSMNIHNSMSQGGVNAHMMSSMEMGWTYVGHGYGTSADDNFIIVGQKPKTIRKMFEPALKCIAMLACAVGDDMWPYMTELLEWMFTCGLSAQLLKTLSAVYTHVHSARSVIEDRLSRIVWTITVQNAHGTIMGGSDIVRSRYALSSSSVHNDEKTAELPPHLLKVGVVGIEQKLNSHSVMYHNTNTSHSSTTNESSATFGNTPEINMYLLNASDLTQLLKAAEQVLGPSYLPF
ncbi:hypothetical protein RFI_15892, partial [Reticulomyxa filosa]